MPGSKFGSLESHDLKKPNMIPRGNKFVRRHDLTVLVKHFHQQFPDTERYKRVSVSPWIV